MVTLIGTTVLPACLYHEAALQFAFNGRTSFNKIEPLPQVHEQQPLMSSWDVDSFIWGKNNL